MNIEIKFQGGKIWQEKTVAILAALSTIGEGEDARVISSFERGVNYLDFYIPKGSKGDPGVKGDKGEKGESGFTDILGAMIVSYNDNPQTFPAAGLEIQSNGRFPLMHVQVDVGGNC